jgi:hypothetical protein
MTRINLVLFRPDHPRWKIANAFQEVIDSLLWGLRDLGYEAAFTVNQLDRRGVNIIFGWIWAYFLDAFDQFPANSILYNLEQFSVGSMRGQPHLEAAAARFQIWDYSLANLPVWQELAPTHPVYYARISFAPSLVRIAPAAVEDIDFLYIGSTGPKRTEKLAAIAGSNQRHGLVSLTNVWGGQRDEFIGRAKVLLNVSSEVPSMKIFEVVRVSYYLANRKAVLCELEDGVDIEPDLRQVLRFAATADLGAAADELMLDPARRERYALDCFEVFRQRDVRDVIRRFFA